MSDYLNEQNPQQEEEQRTRVVPAVPPARHRRSERYHTETSNPSQQGKGAAKTTAKVTTTRVSVQPPQMTEGVPSQGVPRPAVLNRKPELPTGQGGVRRPVSAPGYSQRLPLGAQGTGEVPRVRRPIKLEELEYRDESDTSDTKERGKGGALTVIVAIVLVLALVVLGFMLIPEGDDGLGKLKGQAVEMLQGVLGTEEKEPVSNAQAMDFSAAPTQGTAPLEVAFTLTTTKSVTAVRVVDEEGKVLPTSTSVSVDNADSRSWMLNLSLAEGYSGQVRALIQDGEEWLDAEKALVLEILPPEVSTFTAEPTVTLEPTEEPTVEPTQEPTAEPTQEPTAEPTQEPTEEPTQEPTAEPTQEPTEEPTEVPTPTATATPTIAPTEVPTLEPTEEPTAEPTQEPTAEPTAEPTVEPTVEPTPELVAQAVADADPSLVATTVIYNGKTKLDSYDRSVEDRINMPAGDAYITQPYGVMTYRSNAFRQNAAVGNVGNISTMNLAWTAEAGSVKGASQTYYGIGWMGQPAIVKWSREVRTASNIVEEKRNVKALKEVIIAGMDGRIYFLDLEDGTPTRDAINVGYPMRGTPSVHPLGYPIMSVGQYARKMANGTGKIGLRFFNLLTQKEEYRIDGLDGTLDRPYYPVGAFDTSALIDPVSDTMMTAGTNGMVYLTKLNTTFDYNAGTISIEPESIVMKSKKKGQKDKTTSVEASVASYGKYMFYADLSGLVRCVDTNSLETMWAVDTGDQVEASLALDLDDKNDLWLYSANTLQNRTKGDVTISRFNAMTGEEYWALSVGSQKNTKTKKITGAMASPVVGQNELGDLVIYTLSNLSKEGTQSIFGQEMNAAAGATIAINKRSGEVVWAHELDSYSYSSPVAVYSETGKGWIIQASGAGTLYLLDGLTGSVVNTLEVEGTIEGSPAVYGNTLVIGTTGRNTSYIYGITLD